MKAAEGYTIDHYRGLAPSTKEFSSIEDAARYLAEKWPESIEHYIKAIKDDTNCDAIYFEDGSVGKVILLGF